MVKKNKYNLIIGISGLTVFVFIIVLALLLKGISWHQSKSSTNFLDIRNLKTDILELSVSFLNTESSKVFEKTVDGYPKTAIVIFHNSLGSTQSFNVEVASTEAEREQGLMFRDSIDQNAGMLFVFDKDVRDSFWMKNCKFPLDMVFINKDYKVVEVMRDVQPCKKDPCPVYQPKVEYRYVVEVSN